jgi:hypothetical protein
MRRQQRQRDPAEPRRVVTITISMPKRLLRQVNRLRRQYCYPTMSEYVRERLMADLRLPALAAPAAPAVEVSSPSAT